LGDALLVETIGGEQVHEGPDEPTVLVGRNKQDYFS